MDILQPLLETISLYRYIFWPLLCLLTLIIVLKRWWEQVSYFFLNIAASFPVIGYVARLARSDEPRRVRDDGVNWHPSEEALCAKYWQYYNTSNLTADFYKRCVDYLNKVDELGRKPMSLLLWLCSGGLVLLEAFIFALVLAPFIATNITANQAELSAMVVSVLIGIILVPATHRMGKELHHNDLIRKIRYWYSEARRTSNAKELTKNVRLTLETTHLDDDAPNYLQMLNRVKHNHKITPRYWASVIAVTLILVFAVGAYYVRAATINVHETEAVNGSPFSQQSSAAASPFDLPAAAVADNAAADTQASNEVNDNKVFASKLTFIILSVIFVGVQIIGILIGMYRSFAGTESKAAARYVGDFSGSEEFADWHARRRERVLRNAQDKLKSLQNRMMMKRINSQSEEQSNLPDFEAYINRKGRDRLRMETNQRELAAAQSAINSTPAVTVSAVAQQTAQPQPTTPVAQPVVQQQAAPVTEPAAQPQPASPVVQPAATPVAETAAQPQPAAAPVVNSPQDKQRIDALGDLTTFSEDDLAEIAADQGLSLEALKSRQRVQKLLSARSGGSA